MVLSTFASSKTEIYMQKTHGFLTHEKQVFLQKIYVLKTFPCVIKLNITERAKKSNNLPLQTHKTTFPRLNLKPKPAPVSCAKQPLLADH